MNKKELLEQLKSLEENQRDFISNDDTGVFKRDCKALELAYSIINEIDLNDLECIRICSDCGKIMNAGYCINHGEEYYCSDECLHKHYTNEEFNEMYDDGNGDSYYTEWEN